MAAQNRRVFGRCGTTDVIALPLVPVPGESPALAGEIFVNAEAAVRRAARDGGRPRWSASHELALYIAHGCDHLMGATDRDRAGRRRMRRRELRWVAEADALGLVEGLFTRPR